MIPYKNPNLLIKEIDNCFYIVINTFLKNGIKLINKNQFNILNIIDGYNSIDDIALKTGYNSKDIYSVIQILSKKNIVCFENKFIPLNIKESKGFNNLNLWVHTTNRCNLKCPYCYISTIQTTGGMLDSHIEQLSKKIIETATTQKLKTVYVRLSGGEPLLQFSRWKNFIIKTKTKLNEIGCKFRVAFLTNLTYLDDNIISFSKKYNIGFGVSIDGYDNYHDLTRKFYNDKGSFKIVNDNLTKMLKNRIFPSISIVVSEDNVEGLPILTKYLIDLNLNFRYSIVQGFNIDRELLSRKLQSSFDIMKEAINSQGFEISKKFRLCNLKLLHINEKTCSSGHTGGAININGDIHFCHTEFGKKNILGNIYDNDDILTIINKSKNYLSEYSEDCTKCTYRYVCSGGCPIYRNEGKDLNCELYQKFIPFFYELIGMERLYKINNYQNKV